MIWFIYLEIYPSKKKKKPTNIFKVIFQVKMKYKIF